jgi:succinate dehydrogenase / fumarate reductase iron-sulfur subunit
MRSFKDGDVIYVEPWRARPFPVIRDLMVDRGAFDRIQQAGGYVSINTGGAPRRQRHPVPKAEADRALDAAACIGCGACVAPARTPPRCSSRRPKVSHLLHLPQGQAERDVRVLMVSQMDKEGFGNCTNYGECEAVCPKEISVNFIAELNREYIRASLSGSTEL